jgi:hypothetical protein
MELLGLICSCIQAVVRMTSAAAKAHRYQGLYSERIDSHLCHQAGHRLAHSERHTVVVLIQMRGLTLFRHDM